MKSPFITFLFLIVGAIAVACSAMLLFVRMESVNSVRDFLAICIASAFLFVTGRYFVMTSLLWHDEIKSKYNKKNNHKN